jgi:hypothetical protein
VHRRVHPGAYQQHALPHAARSALSGAHGVGGPRGERQQRCQGQCGGAGDRGAKASGDDADSGAARCSGSVVRKAGVANGCGPNRT